jgi:hypothetical protein
MGKNVKTDTDTETDIDRGLVVVMIWHLFEKLLGLLVIGRLVVQHRADLEIDILQVSQQTDGLLI